MAGLVMFMSSAGNCSSKDLQRGSVFSVVLGDGGTGKGTTSSPAAQLEFARCLPRIELRSNGQPRAAVPTLPSPHERGELLEFGLAAGKSPVAADQPISAAP